MTCDNVGSTNPDIAGLGVVLSFTIQAGLSCCLSFWSDRIRTGTTTLDQPGQPRDGSTVQRDFIVVYDTVNFTGVSAAAALTVVFKRPNAIAFRGSLVIVFLSLYVAFVILFGLKLQSWDDDKPGYCYQADKISTRGAAHPHVDIIYLVITALYLFASLIIALLAADASPQRFIRGLQDPESANDRPSRRNRTLISLGRSLRISESSFFTS
ncbi:hypothetical protein EKO27_g6416 [Xylaria grammica]|uniref:Uncharacterized protein n=1 Tax=Xylaria grammica TaxID=363999 RepID=A0A439D321_9PEZI|nr:hypothetical protein EKO27_g6416 [Xylaria grammica]